MVSGLQLKNRIFMGSMTRCRADQRTGNVTPEMVEYYRQRAESAALVITECLFIDPKHSAYPGGGGLATNEHVTGWQAVTDAVHAQGSYAFAQLYHPGRVQHPDITGAHPLAPSPVQCAAKARVRYELKDHVVPREMTVADIRETQRQFVHATMLAKRAGFDGVELHASNGYLIDQFLRSRTNRRTDAYGGSVANRARYLLELIDQLNAVFPSQRIAVKLSLVGRFQDMRDDDPLTLGKHLAAELGRKEVLYVQFAEAEAPAAFPIDNGQEQIRNCAKAFRASLNSLLVTNGFGDPAEGIRRVEEGEADIAAFSSLYISNPDLPQRLQNGWPLTEPRQEFFYRPGAQGYTDYSKYMPA